MWLKFMWIVVHGSYVLFYLQSCSKAMSIMFDVHIKCFSFHIRPIIFFSCNGKLMFHLMDISGGFIWFNNYFRATYCQQPLPRPKKSVKAFGGSLHSDYSSYKNMWLNACTKLLKIHLLLPKMWEKKPYIFTVYI